MTRTAATTPMPTAGSEPRWSQVWQLPLLLLGVALFGLGIYLAQGEEAPNDFPGALDNVAYYLQAGNLDEAQRELNEIGRQIDSPDATQADRARFQQYLADWTFLQYQQNTPVPVETAATGETFKAVAAGYARADELGRQLDGTALRRYAQALVALGRGAEALKLLDRMQDGPAQRRYRIVRSLIERQRRGRGGSDMAAIMPLIERFKQELRSETDASRRREQERWIAATQASLRLDAEDPQGAIDFLLVKLQRFASEGGDGDLAGLFVLLAEAYQVIGDLPQAERFYRYAQQKIESQDGLNARILLGLGRIVLGSPEDAAVQQALDHFTQATQNFPSEPAYIEALIGRGDCEARLEAYPEAIEHLGLAVAQLVERAPTWDRRRDLVSEVVRTHTLRALDRGEHDLALDLLTLLTPLHEAGLPPEMLLDFATIHENIAEQAAARAEQIDQRLRRGETGASGGTGGTGEAGGGSPEARRLANQQAAMHFERAGDFYMQHAEAVTVIDDAAHGASLWKAASCFNRAEAWPKAIDTYAQFIETRRTDDRRLAAIQKLGMAYLAQGQHAAAAELFLRLVEGHPTSPETYASLVPLARAYEGQGRMDAAERVLLKVVTDHPAVTPESAQYQRALIELGRLYYRLGEADSVYYVQAIERLEEAVRRYGGGEEGPSLRYLLADAYRQSVGELDRRLAERQSQSERGALHVERERRLEAAQIYFSQAATLLDARPPASLSALEKLYRRNAWFYRADCAYDRGQYETAIDLYGSAARRWEKDPAALVAMVQIVNAHCELGQYQQARVANETARWMLQRMPEGAFDDPTLPMTRQRWEDWLRWTSELDLFGKAAARPASAPAR